MASESGSNPAAEQPLTGPGDEGQIANSPQPISIDDFESDEPEFDSEWTDNTSLSSSILQYEYENGRRYHSNRLGNYMMPNDEEEQDRMDLAHHLWLMLLKGELYNAPVKAPHKILDLGTGTGIWALDIAEKFPQAHVIGNDISPIQPNWSLPNVEFIVENFEDEWLYKPNSFDFIHARLLAGCVADWPKFIQTIFQHVKPGGYFEIQESAVWAWSDDGSLKTDSPLLQYVQALDTAGKYMGRELNIYDKLRDWLLAVGFEDVQQSTYFLPYSPWPRDPYLKELGKYQAVQVNQAVESYGLRLLTQVLGWGEDPSRVYQALVKKQLKDKSLHAYVKEVVVYGRKPIHAGRS
ncbi:hypothetical protein N7520_004122 [Penicillium odoratum]|uniref:uncharacterized protein n=1 Tax=Penicillium odoratum TaxID=1167516 RepID=UPI0025490179|nr:uncharacterized protein N7520_004122 [Penicillium odoratum]KAJ5769563.1 hypothetical protein N7520_004122 [Penicillium odoratum]